MCRMKLRMKIETHTLKLNTKVKGRNGFERQCAAGIQVYQYKVVYDKTYPSF